MVWECNGNGFPKNGDMEGGDEKIHKKNGDGDDDNDDGDDDDEDEWRWR
jgi:phosphopantothenoylcysteine synthetase/decarboxylase